MNDFVTVDSSAVNTVIDGLTYPNVTIYNDGPSYDEGRHDTFSNQPAEHIGVTFHFATYGAPPDSKNNTPLSDQEVAAIRREVECLLNAHGLTVVSSSEQINVPYTSDHIHTELAYTFPAGQLDQLKNLRAEMDAMSKLVDGDTLYELFGKARTEGPEGIPLGGNGQDLPTCRSIS